MPSFFISPAAAQEAPAEHSEAAPDALHTEVGHAEDGGHGGVFPPFDFATFPSQLLWLAITFGALYYMVSKVVVPQIGGILEHRRDRIAGDLGEAERLRQETDAAIAGYEQALAEARAKAGAIAQTTRADVAAEIGSKRQAVEAGLATKLADAELRIADIKGKALAEVDAIATETTEALVSALIGSGNTAEAAAAVAAERKV